MDKFMKTVQMTNTEHRELVLLLKGQCDSRPLAELLYRITSVSPAARKKVLIDRNGQEIKTGTTVRYRDGWMSVASVFVGSQRVNLKGIFGSRIVHKRVPLSEIYEDYENWSVAWSKSETYRSM